MAGNKGYKRSWKNYLLDSSYQLRFTFMMVAVAAGLMAPLGWLVKNKADSSTEVALNQIDGRRCPEVPSAAAPTSSNGAAPGGQEVDLDLLEEAPAEEPPPAPPPEGEAAAPTEGDAPAPSEGAVTETEAPAEGADAADGDAAEGEGEGEGEEREHHRPKIQVTIDDSELSAAPVVTVGELEELPASPEEIAKAKKARDKCLAEIAAKKKKVEDRKGLIFMIMIASGVFLLLGLAVYGIKMTHKVAGPLFKVGLYLKKVENNKYDTVYNLRKGDQLVEFYEHFKSAHAGLRTMQEEDLEQLKKAVALAKEAKLGAKNSELAELIKELEAQLKEKEESLG